MALQGVNCISSVTADNPAKLSEALKLDRNEIPLIIFDWAREVKRALTSE